MLCDAPWCVSRLLGLLGAANRQRTWQHMNARAAIVFRWALIIQKREGEVKYPYIPLGFLYIHLNTRRWRWFFGSLSQQPKNSTAVLHSCLLERMCAIIIIYLGLLLNTRGRAERYFDSPSFSCTCPQMGIWDPELTAGHFWVITVASNAICLCRTMIIQNSVGHKT